MQRDPWLEDLRGLAGRIGLYGGSFDPVHRAHLEVARSAQRAHALDALVFVPAAKSPMKPRGPRASDAARLAMLRLALRDEAAFFVSPLEIQRAGTSYTADTLAIVRAQVRPDAELFLVIGSDCLPDFPRWVNVERILALARICAVEREGFSRDDLQKLEGALGAEHVAALRRDFVSRAPIPGSSTEVRAALERGAIDGADLPSAVAAYVREKGLYR